MNDKRTYAAVTELQGTSRPSLEGMINVLTDKLDYVTKQAGELHSLLGSILYPLPPTGVGISGNLKDVQPTLPPAIERLDSLCRKLDKLNDDLSSIQSRLCI